MIVYVVIIPNGMILAAYDTENHADIHARTILGARMQHLEVRSRLDSSVLDDLASEDWDDDNDTPVEEPEQDLRRTNPSTPTTKKKGRPS